MAQQTALATMLAHIGRLKVLTAALSDARSTEAQAVLDARAALKEPALALVPAATRAAMLGGVQASASNRHRARRIAIIAEIDTIRTALPALADQASLDLAVLIEEVRGNEVFVPEDRHLFTRAAAA